MKYKKFPLLVLFAVLLSVLSGCQTQRGDRTYTNFLGIYERETNSYSQVPEATFALKKGDIDPGAEYSGDKVSLLWGLFTYYDY